MDRDKLPVAHHAIKHPVANLIQRIERHIAEHGHGSPLSCALLKEAVDLLSHTPAAAPSGWKMVPVEPTPEMMDAAEQWDRDAPPKQYENIYRAMVSASRG